MNNKNHKSIYAALQFKEVPFTVFVKDEKWVFSFNKNTIVFDEENFVVNKETYNNLEDVLTFIKEA